MALSCSLWHAVLGRAPKEAASGRHSSLHYRESVYIYHTDRQTYTPQPEDQGLEEVPRQYARKPPSSPWRPIERPQLVASGPTCRASATINLSRASWPRTIRTSSACTHASFPIGTPRLLKPSAARSTRTPGASSTNCDSVRQSPAGEVKVSQPPGLFESSLLFVVASL